MRKFENIFERAIREFGLNPVLYMAVIIFFKHGGADFFPKPGLEWLQEVVEAKKRDLKFWKSNGEDTVELLKNLVAQKDEKYNADHHRLITVISDILTDNGVRGAGTARSHYAKPQRRAPPVHPSGDAASDVVSC